MHAAAMADAVLHSLVRRPADAILTPLGGRESRRCTVVAGEDEVRVDLLLSPAPVCPLVSVDAGAVVKVVRPVLDGEMRVHGHLVVRPCASLA